MARISNLSRAELDDDVFAGRTGRAPLPQKSITPVPAPVQATTPAPAAPTTSNNAAADFLAKINPNPSGHRGNVALSALGEFAGYKGDPMSEASRAAIQDVIEGNASGKYYANESGVNYAPDLSGSLTYNQQLLDALNGYTFTPTSDVERTGYTITAPDGRSRVINWGDKSSSFDKLAEAAIPAILSGMTGGALAGPLLGALGITATPIATGIATGGISGGVGAGIQGGNILEGILKGGVSGGIGGGITQGINAIAPAATSKVTDALQAMGVPEATAMDLAEYTKPVIRGAVRGAASGNLLGGITDAVAGQIVADISPSLKLTPAQGVAVANYLRTGDETALVTSLGSGLARDAIKASSDAAKNTSAPTAPTTPVNYGSIDNELGFANYEPEDPFGGVNPYNPAPREITAIQPPSEIDVGDYLDSIAQDGYNSTPDLTSYVSSPAPAPGPTQQVAVTGVNTSPVDDYYQYIPSLTGERSNIDMAPGAGTQTVTVTGKKPLPEDDLLDLLPAPQAPSIPDLQPMPIPAVPAPAPAPRPAAPPLTPAPAPRSNGMDMSGLLNVLAMNQQQPVPSQVLAQMPGFNVDKQMNYAMQDEQPDLSALLATIGFKG